ncbi:MAG: GNAT family N-acyltransferase [Pseudomonadota bacterium]
MAIFGSGRYRTRFAESEADVGMCQRLRYLSFIENRGMAGDTSQALDTDEFDQHCTHVLIEDTRTNTLVCCFRMLALPNGSAIERSYAAKYYGLDNLAGYPAKMIEMGRFCIHPAWRDPDILRVAWGAMTRFVEAERVGLLFGCSSFHGVDAEAYMDAFALLKERHLAPSRWLPRVKAPRVFRYAVTLRLRKPDLKLALKGMPPLLRTYLHMGGWVSDHAVIDMELNTLHVFTGVEIDKVPAARSRLLRRAAEA